MRDVLRPGGGESRMTWRLLGNLIRHLPPESATKTALRNKMSDAEIAQAAKHGDPSQGQWSQLEMLMATISDKLSWLLHATLVANGGKSKKPEPTPRPGVKAKSAKRHRALTAEQSEAVLRRIHGADLHGTWQHTKPGRVAHLPRSN
ncbi:hypothetical protein E1286_05220 [Nonomuraea terrae]|uniref:Uncharacterized protein n=1 Tax=Nonomuraea terrae TaxID=2530383 RepID=A0A4R4Z8G5_9ACTN|nr:hypothetical protein [Nonomuraea terrae]TDD54591.1 hypothetical protein E1286_05220 [Nonomuraea terrae]